MASNKGRFNMLHSLSLRAKILLPFIILMLAGFAVVVGYNSWAMRQHDLEQGVENARLQAAVLSTSINKTLNDGLSTTQTLTSTFEILRRSHVVNRDMLNKILARQLENHAGLRAVWTGWEPDALDGHDSEYAGQKPAHDDSGRFVPYWHRDTQGISVEPLVDYDKPGAGDYYLLPKQTGSLQVIEPYLHPVNGKPVMTTSIVAPLMVGITFSGVVGVDIALTDIAARHTADRRANFDIYLPLLYPQIGHRMRLRVRAPGEAAEREVRVDGLTRAQRRARDDGGTGEGKSQFR